jgi:hypothetical protein
LYTISRAPIGLLGLRFLEGLRTARLDAAAPLMGVEELFSCIEK